jgi:hypothetical protein
MRDGDWVGVRLSPDGDAGAWLSRVPDASARVMWAADVTDAVVAVAQVEEAAGGTVVTSWCDAAGKSADLLDDVLAGLAGLLARLWPRWYGAARDAHRVRGADLRVDG